MIDSRSLAMSGIFTRVKDSSIKFFGEHTQELYNPLLIGNYDMMRELLKHHYKTFLSNHKGENLDIYRYKLLQGEGFTNISLCNSDVTTLTKLAPQFEQHLRLDTSFVNGNRESTHFSIDKHISDFAMELFFKYKLNNIFNVIFSSESWIINRIQGFAAQRLSPNKLVTSARFWHRDSIGRRFKIWFPIKINKYGPKTELITTSQVQDPIPRQWEMLRTDHNFINSTEQVIFSEKIQSHWGYKKLNLLNDKIVILDTNAIHKGDYAAHSEDADSLRIYLEISIRGSKTAEIFNKINGIANPNLDVSDKYKKYCCPKHFKQ